MKYQANKDIITREIAGELVLVPVGKMTRSFNGMVTLSESGQVLWKAMTEEARSEDELVALLTGTYDCTPDQARDDIRVFLNQLLPKEVLVTLQ